MNLTKHKIGVLEGMPVYVKNPYTHVIVGGKSGEGKSEWLANIWKQHSYFPYSKILVDPSGFLAQKCYSISKGEAVYCSVDHPIPLNPMCLPYRPEIIVDTIVEAIDQSILLGRGGALKPLTPKMYVILDEKVRWCLDRKRLSLLHVRDEIDKMKGHKETKDGLLARLNYLLADERLKPIICGSNAVNVGGLIQKKQSFIFDASQLGRDRLIFVGVLFMGLVKSYLRYERLKKYQSLLLMVDEAHLLVSEDTLVVLIEGRKYKIGGIFATAGFSTVPDGIRRALLNVGTVMTFKCGHREAKYFGNELRMDAKELQTLPKYHLAYLTEDSTGIVKAPYPVYAKPLKPKARLKPKSGGWFKLQPHCSTSLP